MKKIIAIILSIFLITAPIYSYAVLPFVAAAAATMTRVLVGNAIKKPTQSALGRAGMSLLGICKGSNAIRCAGLGLGLANILNDDGWQIEIGGEGDTINNNDINIDIYQINNECKREIRFSSNDNYINDYKLFYDAVVANRKNRYADAAPNVYDDWEPPFLEHMDFYNAKQETYEINEDWQYLGAVRFKVSIKYSESSTWSTDAISTNTYYRCLPVDDNKTYMDVNEFYNYMQENLTANDILNIYNYDYSQHPNITINNNTTTGDTVNNNLRAPSAGDKTVSNDLKNNIENNNINMDDVNDQNCTKNELGEYDQCGDTDPDPEDPDPEPEDPTDPEPQPQVCMSSEFTQTVCEFIAYMKGDFDVPDAQPVDVDVKQPEQSPSDFDKSYVEFGKVCPSFAPTDIEFGAGSTSFTQSLSIDIQVWCDFAEYIRPVVEWSGRFIAFGIIAAAIRNT